MMHASAKMLALGRLKAGTLNKTEQAYEGFLRTLQLCGDVVWYKFEGVKLRLADNTFLTPDFFVMRANGEMEIHEVKGAKAIFRDDARAKSKIAAATFPFRFLVVYPAKKNGSWDIEEL